MHTFFTGLKIFVLETDMFFHLSTPAQCLSTFQVYFKLLAASRFQQYNLLHALVSRETTMIDLLNDNKLSEICSQLFLLPNFP